MEVASEYQEQLERIKKSVRNAYDYFKPNYDRYNEFRKFVFETSLSQDDTSLLQTMGKPQLEFNILEAYVSRLLGEFSKQEPSIEVSAENPDQADPQMIQVVEQHMRHTLFDSKNYHSKYEVYKDLLSGGFSVFKVSTDYSNPMSFNQNICFDRAYDPTLCGFDELARYSHKGDGKFCFELFPMEKDKFVEKYPKVDISTISFRRDFAGFNWSYVNNSTQILLVADYYEKKMKRKKIVQTADGKVMTMKQYQAMVNEWEGFIPPPAIMGEPRMTELETICRYRLIENQVLEYEETDYTYFPLIFVDGNSMLIRGNKNGNISQVTRPYVYQAKGAQKLKNFSGITIANEMENMVQHKFKVAKESLPKEEDWLQAYKDIQKPSTLVYNAFYENDPDKPCPPPEEIARVPMPQEVVQSFVGADQLIQNILGSYDASLGINDNQLSGVAIVEAATQSNAAAMPYVVGFLQGLQRVAECILDLIPKYYKTPRTIPVQGVDGKKNYVKINQPGGIDMDYSDNPLNVKVEAGVNFQIQKSRALQQIIGLMQSSEQFGQFMNEKGLPVLLDNIEIRGIDQIKIMAEDWLKEVQEQKAAAMQQQQAEMQNNPLVMKNQIEMQKLQQKGQVDQAQFTIDMQKLKQDEMKVISDAMLSRDEAEVQKLKAHAEMFAKSVELKLAHRDQLHRHHKEVLETGHLLSQPKKLEGGSANANA